MKSIIRQAEEVPSVTGEGCAELVTSTRSTLPYTSGATLLLLIPKPYLNSDVSSTSSAGSTRITPIKDHTDNELTELRKEACIDMTIFDK